MIQYNYTITGIKDLTHILQSQEIQSFSNFKSQLIQIYSAENDPDWYKTIGKLILRNIPSAVVVGASSVGEIEKGKIHTGSTVLLFSFFESSAVHLLSHQCYAGEEVSVGKTILKQTHELEINIKGLLLLSTPISQDSGTVFNTITEGQLAYPVFGGGAGDYANERKTLVYDGSNCFNAGVVAVLFSGENLHIELLSCLGWYPLSKEMTITETGPTSVKTIDNMPAFSVYKKYLGIKADSQFFQNSLEFPFLITRNNETIARTPFFANEEDGSIQLVADIKTGEKFRIGYGNPQTILEESNLLQHQMQNFNPEAIFIYSCICRRFLMQDEVDIETKPFQQIAPTAGVYTFGEFFSKGTFKSLYNSSLVTVGFREGASKYDTTVKPFLKNAEKDTDPYAKQHNRILSRLLYFIDELINEFEEQNQQLLELNEQKNELLGIAAHDLRNPIGLIQGYAEILEEDIDEENKEFVSIIIKQSSKMLTLLHDLLDFSKIESGRLDLTLEQIDYVSVVDQNVRMNQRLAQKKGIKILSVFEINEQILLIDIGKIEQVLNNVIGNAIKYSYPDSEILVKVFREGDQIVTQIQDQGEGIPKDEIEGIFQPFKKSSVKPTAGESSHGLGLAIVKKVVGGHKGSVGVTSEVGKGSVFYFALPL